MPPPPFLKRVNFNGDVSNKRPSRCKEGERNDAFCYENIYIHWKFTILSFVFCKTSLNMAVFLFITCSLPYNTLAIFPDSLRATYFPGITKPILAAIVLLEHDVPLKFI